MSETQTQYRRSVARSIRSKVPSEWYLQDALEGSDRTAIAIALDELEAYIGAMSQEVTEVQGEADLERLVWATKRLRSLLAREDDR